MARFSTSTSGSDYEVKIDLDSEEHRYVEGHTIDGRMIFPATGYMVIMTSMVLICSLYDFKNYVLADKIFNSFSVLCS